MPELSAKISLTCKLYFQEKSFFTPQGMASQLVTGCRYFKSLSCILYNLRHHSHLMKTQQAPITAQALMVPSSGITHPEQRSLQMVSLLHLAEITEKGVTFQSPVDGSSMLLTPEHSMAIQNRLGGPAG